MNNVKSPAIAILTEFFKSGTNLNKELQLYQSLMKEKYSNEKKANQLIDEILKRIVTINKSSARKEKFNLIKEIKKHYNLDDFFKNHVNNYKVYASIYKLLENKDFSFSPAEIITSRSTIVEFITSKPTDGKTTRSQIIDEYSKQDTNVRKLAYKILIDKFNSKYQDLGDREKRVLREYINNISDTPKMKEFVNSELTTLRNSILVNSKKLHDSATKIKLHEVLHIVESIISKKKFSESILLTLLHIYKLDDEVKKLIK